MTTALAFDARKLLIAIADAKRAAVTLRELQDDDLPGKVGDFVLLHPDGTNCAVTETFMQRAALAFLASHRFMPGKPSPRISPRDLPRAKKLVNAMRKALITKRNAEPAVIPPPNFLELARAS